MPIFRVRHHTEYNYSAPVALSYNEARLRPRLMAHQTLVAHALVVEPPVSFACDRQDFFGNPVCHFSIEEPHTRLLVASQSVIRIDDLLAAEESLPWEEAARLTREDYSHLEASPFTLDSPFVARSPEARQYAMASFAPKRTVFLAALDLASRIHQDFAYHPGFTTVATPLSWVFAHRQGVCQDFAHVAIACLRSLGLAARYVSGYLETLPPPGQEKLVGADASHAWFSVYDPLAGWLSFDPTNDQVPASQHLTVGWGRDYTDVSPIKGVFLGAGAGHLSRVCVDVERIA